MQNNGQFYAKIAPIGEDLRDFSARNFSAGLVILILIDNASGDCICDKFTYGVLQ
jgi:hypothetical protein